MNCICENQLVHRSLPTHHAPAVRGTTSLIQHQRKFFTHLPLSRFFDALPNFFLILNTYRQIVFANRSFLKFVKLNNVDDIYGMRPGEALNCIHAQDTEAGCGTSEFCKNCGAVNAILCNSQGQKDVQECCIQQKNTGDALDFRVWATPYPIGEEIYTILVVEDISHEKRRLALERIFYHDVLNTASGILGVAYLLKNSQEDRTKKYCKHLEVLSRRIVEEIESQRELMAAENGDLVPSLTRFPTLPLLHNVMALYEDHEVGKNKELRVDDSCPDIEIKTDRVLLMRVLGNMVKNALEAIGPGETVTLGCDAQDGRVRFWVHNPGVIDRNIQLQIFQRSFSTKGSGRGLGTYSIKLLSERFLKGKVGFTTTVEEGTRFEAVIPL